MAYCICPGWLWWWWSWWNENWQGKPKFSGKTCPSATLSTTNPTWPDPGRRGGKPAINRLSYGAATGSVLSGYLYITWRFCACKWCMCYFPLVVPWVTVVKLFCNENGYFSVASYLICYFLLLTCTLYRVLYRVPRLLAVRQQLFPFCGSLCANYSLMLGYAVA
jgi:hypothetical protein